MPPRPAPLTRETAFVIWSEKHGAWWRAHQCGYTKDLHHAGIYRETEALDIAERSGGGLPAERSRAVTLEQALTQQHVEALRHSTVAWLLTSERPTPNLEDILTHFYDHSLEVHP
jgi:hypothetical protein